MPRPKDIAWKFVIRLEGQKWRCPYCHKIFSGSVTRVKDHFLKQPKGGITSCTRVPEHIRTLMELLHNHQVPNKEYIAWIFVDRVEDSKWRCYYCSAEFSGDVTGVKGHLLEVPNEGISICREVPDHIRKLMLSLLDEVAEEENREANGQSSTEPQAHDMPTQAEVWAEEESREAQFSMEPQTRDTPTQAEVAEGREANRQFSVASIDQHSMWEMLRGAQDSHVQPALVSPQPQCVLHPLINHETRDMQQNATMPLDNRDTTQQPDLHDSLLENLVESRKDCSQPFAVEEVPLLSNTNPTDAVQHPDQLHSRCDKEDGNDTRVPSPTPMDIDRSIAPQHRSDTHIIEATTFVSQVLEAATNTRGPSSSRDMNRGSAILDSRSIYASYEEIRNLKRKVEDLNNKEAVIKEQMEIESSASSVRKKPRILVERCLKETEKARNNFQIIVQDNMETLLAKEQVETLTREVEELIEQTTLLIEARDAKGDAFLERKLIGKAIHWNVKLIWDRLKKNHVRKLGIHGMGGVGKTTIMMHIHNRLLKDETFDVVAFVTVSKDFSNYKLQSDIWKALKFGDLVDEDEKKRAAMLWKRLECGKNYVVILDDVWQHFKLQDVGIPDRAGLKVVLTTRFSEVCSRMDCEEIKIQPLGEEEAWELFMEELGPKPLTNIQVEKVARKIANRCAGLPLAINTMASSLRGEKKLCVWQDTLNKLQRSHTEHTEMGDKVLPVLALSYKRLSDPQIKQCFLFCALLPKDISLRQMQLIEYFIDEGFLDEADTREEQYCRGLAIVHTLQSACLLEVYHGCVRMHDLIREMALHIMSTTYMVKAGQGWQRIPDGEYWTKDLEKVLLMQGCIKDIPPDLSPNCPKLSTFVLRGGLDLTMVQIRDPFFMNMRGLKVLNLSECWTLTQLPDSLSELANLQALVLRGCCSLRRIPYLGKLKFLRKLDVSNCGHLLEVNGLEELRKLRYLDLSGSGIERLLKGTLRRMVNLQYLKAKRLKANEVIQLKALERLKCYFGNVTDFNKYVRIIELSGRHHYRLIVDQKIRLWSVSAYLYSDHEILPENELKYDEDYYRYKYVEIRSCNYAMARVKEEMNNDSILIPGDVEFFRLQNWCGMTNLSGMGRLRSLKVLIIKEWDNPVVLFGGAGVDEEVRNTCDSPAPPFPSLEVLKIEGCSKLKYLFGHESRFSLPLLREVSIYQCKGIEGMTASVASPPQLGGPAFPTLERITLENCGNMKRLVGSEWLSHFPNLTTIKVESCNKIRELLPHEGLLHLPNLVHISVHGCEGIEEIISGGGENHGGSAPSNAPSSSLPSPFSAVKLGRLVLQDLPKLKSICEGHLSFIPGAFVHIDYCPKLDRIPPQVLIRLNFLTQMLIINGPPESSGNYYCSEVEGISAEVLNYFNYFWKETLVGWAMNHSTAILSS